MVVEQGRGSRCGVVRGAERGAGLAGTGLCTRQASLPIKGLAVPDHAPSWAPIPRPPSRLSMTHARLTLRYSRGLRQRAVAPMSACGAIMMPAAAAAAAAHTGRCAWGAVPYGAGGDGRGVCGFAGSSAHMHPATPMRGDLVLPSNCPPPNRRDRPTDSTTPTDTPLTTHHEVVEVLHGKGRHAAAPHPGDGVLWPRAGARGEGARGGGGGRRSTG